MDVLFFLAILTVLNLVAIGAIRDRLSPGVWRGLNTPGGRSFYRLWATLVFLLDGVLVVMVGVAALVFFRKIDL